MRLTFLLRRKAHLAWKSLTSSPADGPDAPDFVDRLHRRWARGKGHEIRYWRRYLAPGGYGAADFSRRMDPDLPLQDYVTRWLDPAAESVTILDVGAGPLTILGKVWEGHDVEITPVDALADAYDEALAREGIVPLVRTITCPTEALARRFQPEQFDLAHAHNALDHHAEILRAIEQMLRVTRVGGHVVMRHGRNEAERAGYIGLHQWNLSIDGSDYVVWNREVRTTLGEQVGDRAEIVHMERMEEPWEVVVMRKLLSLPSQDAAQASGGVRSQT
jgi:SAM-dependent methyltransferase